MQEVFILTDYLGRFESKYHDHPYRSGMDLSLISKYFYEKGFITSVYSFADVKSNWRMFVGKPVIYTSSEDNGFLYKAFIEDIILFLDLANAKIIPGFALLRSNNNKVMMELIRELQIAEKGRTLNTYVFGTFNEIQLIRENSVFVVKEASGAQSRGVYLGQDRKTLLKFIKKASRTFNMLDSFKNIIRRYKFPGYKEESQYRRKFIVQEFVPDLSSDFKVLLFGNRAYILRRGIRKNDFRASGSKWNYLLGEAAKPPQGIFDFCLGIKKTLDVPNISIDVAYDGMRFHLIEFQCLYFGSYTQENSDCFYILENQEWVPVYEKLELEKVYVDAVCDYLHSSKG